MKLQAAKKWENDVEFDELDVLILDIVNQKLPDGTLVKNCPSDDTKEKRQTLPGWGPWFKPGPRLRRIDRPSSGRAPRLWTRCFSATDEDAIESPSGNKLISLMTKKNVKMSLGIRLKLKIYAKKHLIAMKIC